MHRQRLAASLRHVLRPAHRLADARRFKGSSRYWEDRYRAGGDSGAGSYGELAAFKADVLNRWTEQFRVSSVIEFGCGDGHQLSLAKYPRYIGLDPAPSAIDRCHRLFESDMTKSFYLYSTRHFVDNHRLFSADMAISLDVIFHLVEDEIFHAYMKHLFSAAIRFVVIYSTDSAIADDAPHVRHRHYSSWVESHAKDWLVSQRVTNPHVSTVGAAGDFTLYERSL